MPTSSQVEEFLAAVAEAAVGRAGAERQLQEALQPLQGDVRALAGSFADLAREQAAARGQWLQAARLAEIGMALAEVVHELRQPLSGIAGFAQLLESNARPSEAPNYGREILAQIARMQGFIERLRRFAKGEDPASGPASCDPLGAVREALALFPQTLPGVRTEVELPEALPAVAIDSSRLVQVLTNLVGNARDACAERAPARILLSARLDEQTVELIVADQGGGIAPEIAERLFTPFATTKGTAGTGLGLYVCQQLVEAAGGAIGLLSPAPSPFDTAFRLRLPVAADAPAADCEIVARGDAGIAAPARADLAAAGRDASTASMGRPPHTGPAKAALASNSAGQTRTRAEAAASASGNAVATSGGSVAAAGDPAQAVLEEIAAALEKLPAARRIVIADADASLRRAIHVLLASQPALDIAQASDGEQAMKLLGASGAELLIVDRRLPAVDGGELARWARRRGLGLELLLLTDLPGTDSVLDAIGLGALDYLVKPLPDAYALRLRVEQAMHRQRRRRWVQALAPQMTLWSERLKQSLSAPLAFKLREALAEMASPVEGPAHVTIVGDASAADAVTVAGHLAERYADPAQAAAALRDRPCEALLFAGRVDFDAALALAQRVAGDAPPPPVVWAGAAPDLNRALALLRAGTRAVLPTPVPARELSQVLHRALRWRRDEAHAVAFETVVTELRLERRPAPTPPRR